MSDLLIHPMRAVDLPQALRLQDICYRPALRDSLPAFRSRIDLPGNCCFVAVAGDDLFGYILAHPWPSMRPPKPDTVLVQPDGALIHYIHDLSVDLRERQAGIGRRLVAASQGEVRKLGIRRSELIAVEGAGPYWRGLGYEAVAVDEELERKLLFYGEGAEYLMRSLDVDAQN